MRNLMLRNSQRLEGPHRVTATVRPLRLAFLVNPDDPSSALAAVDACCLLWGGPYQFLIPCSPGAEPEGFWADLLDHHDPDEIVDLVGASEAFYIRQQDSKLRQVSRWDRPTETMFLRGAVVTSTLQRGLKEGWWKRDMMVRNVHPLFGNPLALQLAFVHGHLERRPFDPKDHFLLPYQLSELDELMQIRSIDPRNVSGEELLRLTTDQALPLPISPPTAPIEWADAPAANLITVVSQPGHISVSYPLAKGSELSEPSGQPSSLYHHRIVVVGEAGSTLDLCLAWNLRAQRSGDRPFPVWFSPSEMESSYVRERLEAVRSFPPGLEPVQVEQKVLGLVSATLADSELSALATDLPKSVAIRSDNWRALFPNQFKFGVDRQSTAIFVAGIGDVGLPDVSDIGEFSWAEALGVTVAIPGWRLPRMPQPPFGGPNQLTRVARDGFVGALLPKWSISPEFVTVYARNGAEALASIAAQAGCEAIASPPGLLAMAVSDLFDSINGLQLMASSTVYGLLRKMANIVSRKAVQEALNRALSQPPEDSAITDVVGILQERFTGGGVFDRPHFTWDELASELETRRPETTSVVKFLVRRGVLFRGYEVKCPVCGLTRWNPVDRLSTTLHCEGCQTTSPLPLRVDAPLVWQYRLNELVARAVDQGAMCHLLVVHYLAAQDRGIDRRLLGVHPGVRFVPIADCAYAGLKETEIDVVAIVDGLPVLSECKEDGAKLTSHDVKKLFSVANRLDQATVILATPTDFSLVQEVVELARAEQGNHHLLVLEGADLLDPRPHHSMEQQNPREYLEAVAKQLRPDSVE